MFMWETVCLIILVFRLETSDCIGWPSGTYGLPKPTSGCPWADGFQWKTGWRSQDMNGDYSNNLKSAEFHLDGEVDNKKVNRSFCMKTDTTNDKNRSTWPSGQYCIYKKRRCPAGLSNGYVKWDDDDTNTTFTIKGGTLPGGKYNHDTEIRFCCKIDGDKNKPILLPTKTPFFPLAYNSSKCQMVKWATASLQWIYYDTEDRTQNSDKAGGKYPYDAGKKHPTIYYCYYRKCNKTLTGLSGTFHSPNYPRKYPDGQYCSWRITVSPGQQIHLTFTNFSLQSENNTDSLYVYDGENATGEVVGVFYGGHPPPKDGVNSSSNHMFVIFKSDKSVSETGFSASYTAINYLEPTVATTTAHTLKGTSSLPTLETTTSSQASSPIKSRKFNKDIIHGPVIGVVSVIFTVFIIYTVRKLWKRRADNRLAGIPVSGRGTHVFIRQTDECDMNTTGQQHPGQDMDLREVSQSPEISEETADTETLPFLDYAPPVHPGTRSWEVPRGNVVIEKIIGKGNFGQVAQGKASELRGTAETTTVAIKMLKDNAPETDRKDLLSELEVMKKLKPHPHVIKLLGCVTESEPLLVIIEYVPYGDLLGYLRKSRGLNDMYYEDPDVKPQSSLTSQQLMKFSWQVADGMRYLSSRSIIHRDLAARNVLVGEQERCKVTDFGMARDVYQKNIYEMKTRGRLPVKWTAYEGLMYERYTTKSDVWSYGVVLYEIFTVGGSPYPRTNGQQIPALLRRGYRMPKPKHVDDALYKIMLNCWEEDPDDRPTFQHLTNELKEMKKQHKTYINMQDYDTKLYENVDDLMF